ncbi:hypothetical protein SEA_ATUIN_221 [Arthrobacter phage Atuin]|nr:hypothetical protein SEA_ATUIN_20 [Arthrobacter phage Atuin]
MIDEVLMAEVRDQLMFVNNDDEELVDEILSDLKSEGMFDIPLGFDTYPDDELGTMPLW